MDNRDINAVQLIYDIQTEINNLMQEYNIIPVQYSDTEIEIIKNNKKQKINFREHDMESISKLLADSTYSGY